MKEFLLVLSFILVLVQTIEKLYLEAVLNLCLFIPVYTS